MRRWPRRPGRGRGYAYFGNVPLSIHGPWFPGSIAIPFESFHRDSGVLAHEMMHWLVAGNGCHHHVLNEGMARRTEDAWEGVDSYERVAAVFAQSGNLDKVPWAIAYDVGASLVEFIWSQGLHARVELWDSSCPQPASDCDDYANLVDFYGESWRVTLED